MLCGRIEDCPQVTFNLKLFQQMQTQSHYEVLSSEVLSEESPIRHSHHSGTLIINVLFCYRTSHSEMSSADPNINYS